MRMMMIEMKFMFIGNVDVNRDVCTQLKDEQDE